MLSGLQWAYFGIVNVTSKMKPNFSTTTVGYCPRHTLFFQTLCECAASAWAQMGGDAYIFDGPRSTPQLSFR
jgi:phosphoglucomutase